MAADVPAPEDGRSSGGMTGLPALGRVVRGARKVRMADVGEDRRARLDALARYLHDVAEDDAAGADLPPTVGWVLRSTRMEVVAFPALGEELTLHTFCSAAASRWAERTTVVEGSNGARARAVSIWVALDMATGAPVRLGEWFSAVYGPSAGGRRASARLTLEPPGAAVVGSGRKWPIRRSDVDAWGHVNNAIAWAAVEDAVAIDPAASLVAVLEHHAPIDPATTPVLAVERDTEGSGDSRVWLVLDDAGLDVPPRVLVAAHLVPGSHVPPVPPSAPAAEPRGVRSGDT